MAKWTDISGSGTLIDDVPRPDRGPEIAASTDNRDLHDLINSLTAVGLGINAGLLWLDRDNPDVDAAKRTMKNLLCDFSRMQKLISALAIGRP